MKLYVTIEIILLSIFLHSGLTAQNYSKVNEIVGGLEESLKKILPKENQEKKFEAVQTSETVLATSALLTADSTKLINVSSAKPASETQTSFFSNGSVKIGADVMSRYIWRGVDYGNAPSIQPAITYTLGGFSIGTWGAYSLGSSGTDTLGNAKVFAEHDLWASYSIASSIGTFSLLYTGYFYPSAGLKYFDYSGSGGAHVLEAGVSYSGLETFPLSLAVYYNFHNDVDKSMYVQGSYTFTAATYGLTVFAAATPSKSVWYVTTKGALINVGLTFTKSIKITDAFSLPVSATYSINPHIEQSYLVFGMSF